LAPSLTFHLRNRSGSLAIFATIRRASSRVERDKKATERTAPISIAHITLFGWGPHAWLLRGRPCHDHCGLNRVRHSDRVGTVGRGEAVSAREVITGAPRCDDPTRLVHEIDIRERLQVNGRALRKQAGCSPTDQGGGEPRGVIDAHPSFRPITGNEGFAGPPSYLDREANAAFLKPPTERQGSDGSASGPPKARRRCPLMTQSGHGPQLGSL
jgi:hypothetical protein